jgi:hypothetical protein
MKHFLDWWSLRSRNLSIFMNHSFLFLNRLFYLPVLFWLLFHLVNRIGICWLNFWENRWSDVGFAFISLSLIMVPMPAFVILYFCFQFFQNSILNSIPTFHLEGILAQMFTLLCYHCNSEIFYRFTETSCPSFHLFAIGFISIGSAFSNLCHSCVYCFHRNGLSF